MGLKRVLVTGATGRTGALTLQKLRHELGQGNILVWKRRAEESLIGSVYALIRQFGDACSCLGC